MQTPSARILLLCCLGTGHYFSATCSLIETKLFYFIISKSDVTYVLCDHSEGHLRVLVHSSNKLYRTSNLQLYHSIHLSCHLHTIKKKNCNMHFRSVMSVHKAPKNTSWKWREIIQVHHSMQHLLSEMEGPSRQHSVLTGTVFFSDVLSKWRLPVIQWN